VSCGVRELIGALFYYRADAVGAKHEDEPLMDFCL